jgi:hypothetical protein
MELSLSQNENCLPHLKNDPFYSFVVAFDDRLCDVSSLFVSILPHICLEREAIELAD